MSNIEQMDASQLAMHPGHISASGDTTVILPFEEFSVDLEHNLGRANGNCYQRKPGIPNVHDGQIMIRLKKKRFIVIDYSMTPTPADIACAAVTPHIKCPPGAGQQQCSSTSINCTKIGVPVCLFDSDPDEPTSLYLRSGLCFTCQRLLNEKRRTQRKRKTPNSASGDGTPGTDPNYAGANQKRFRLGGEILDLNPDAVIVNGPIEGTKHHGPGYEYPEIMTDLQKISSEINEDLATLGSTPQDHAQVEQSYNRTFLTFSKGIFLLSQWKASWDAAVAASVAEKATEEVLEGASIADVIASAAAVAAAQASDTVVANHVANQTSSNMIPLLLAADGKEEAHTSEGGELDIKVETTEV